MSFTRPVLLQRSLYRALSPHWYSTASFTPQFVSTIDLPAPHTGIIRILSLYRPQARNAISRQLLQELRSNIDAVAAQYDDEGNELPIKPLYAGAAGEKTIGPVKALVLASAVDGVFCAGADLKERRGFSGEETQAFLTHLRSTLTALSHLPIPTISAIAGPALGGGLELALATHMRVLASAAIVGLPETRLGIIPGAGGTYRLPALIGFARARDLIITGRRVGASEAYFLGLADRLVDVETKDREGEDGEKDEGKEKGRRAREMTLKEAVRLAGEICAGGPVAVRAGLRAVDAAREEVENSMYERVVGTEDRHEALIAFREKRRPVFKGR